MSEKRMVDIRGKEEDFLKEMREECVQNTDGIKHIHDAGIADLKMLLGEDQWDKAVAEWRTQNKRPTFTQNLLPAFTDQVKNDQRQQRPQIKAIPVDDKGDPKTANVIAGLIRNIWYQSQADAIHDGAFDSVVDGGLGAWRVKPQYEGPMSFNQELRLEAIENPFSVIWDLSAKKFDTSDKKRCWIHEVLKKAEFEKRYPKADISSMETTGEGNTYAGWFMKDEVRIAEYWYVDEKEEDIVLFSNGEVAVKKDEKKIQKILRLMAGVRVIDERTTTIPQIRSCIVSGAEILEGPFEIPGQYIPIIIAFGKLLNVQGKKHVKSLIRDARQTQQIHNYLITAMIESYSMQPNVPYVGTKKHFEGVENQWGTANIGGQAYLPYNPDPQSPGTKPQREQPPAISNQLFPMIEGNKQNMRAIVGIYEAGLGMKSNETSGRAILAKERQGDTGSFVFLSNMLMAIQFEGRILADMIPHYYDAPRSAMITGLEGEHTKVLLNQQQVIDGKPVMYSMATGKYDVIITTGPSFASQRQETMQSMIDLLQPVMQTNPNAGSVLLYEIVKQIDTVNSELLQRLIRATLPPELQQILNEESAAGMQGNPEFLQMKQVLEQQVSQQVAEMQAAIEQLQQELQKAQAQEASNMAKVSLEGEKAKQQMEIERYKAEEKAKLDREIAFENLRLKAMEIAEQNKLLDRKTAAEIIQKDRMHQADGMREEKRMMMSESKEKEAQEQKPIVVQPDTATKIITITGPSGQKYQGEVKTVEKTEETNGRNV